MLARLLVAASVVWPLLAGAAVAHQIANHDDGPPLWVAAVYLASGQVCHQKPERSFQTQGVMWPVCARCSGLYLAAPFAAVIAVSRRRVTTHPPLRLLAVAAVPTALTLFWEWGGLGMPPNLWRLATALPLGAAVTIVLIGVVSPREPAESIG